jgi:hypothetical protein
VIADEGVFVHGWEAVGIWDLHAWHEAVLEFTVLNGFFVEVLKWSTLVGPDVEAVGGDVCRLQFGKTRGSILAF